MRPGRKGVHVRQDSFTRTFRAGASRSKGAAPRQGDAASERIDRGYLGRILQLALLAPDIVEAILDGRHPAEPGLPKPMLPFPVYWPGQRIAFAEAAHREPPLGAPNRG